jgi:ABC-type phosphate transport system substrate-binding protein
MIRWPHPAARSAMLTLTVACAAFAAPLAAQQTSSEPTLTAAPTQASSAPAVQATASTESAPVTQAAGPRVNRMERVEPKFNTPTRYAAQETDINHSYLIYILVAAVLVVLLIFLIKRA